MQLLALLSAMGAIWMLYATDPGTAIELSGRGRGSRWELRIPRVAMEHSRDSHGTGRYEGNLSIIRADDSVEWAGPIYLLRAWRVETTGQFGLRIALDEQSSMEVRTPMDPLGLPASLLLSVGSALTAEVVVDPRPKMGVAPSHFSLAAP